MRNTQNVDDGPYESTTCFHLSFLNDSILDCPHPTRYMYTTKKSKLAASRPITSVPKIFCCTYTSKDHHDCKTLDLVPYTKHALYVRGREALLWLI